MSDTDRYISAMTQAKVLLNKGIISQKEYADFDTIMANWIKKKVVINILTSCACRAIISVLIGGEQIADNFEIYHSTARSRMYLSF